MTAAPALTALCPTWCINGAGCTGEHFDLKTYLDAAVGDQWSPGRGALVVGVGIERSDLEDEQASLVLHVDGPDADFDVLLSPAAARAVVVQLNVRLALLDAAAI
jgi:hypothetical protein